MKKSQVYTRGGDKGETSLVNGSRISKSDERINLYGDLDELNSHLGHFLSLLESEEKFTQIQTLSQKIQSALFDLGSRLACESQFWDKYKLPEIKIELINEMEAQIDELDGELPKMKYFILPSGTHAASYSHIVRTVCRRVERKLVGFGSENTIPTNSLEFLNRLSDYLFVVGRYVNLKQGKKETPWVP